MRKTSLISLLLCVMLAVSGCSLLDSGKYRKAQELFEQGSYAEARAAFAGISDYEDSARYLAYIDAAQLAEKGDFGGASAGFGALSDFGGSGTLAAYYAARLAEQEQRYEDAGELYRQVSAHSDSARRMAALPDLIKARDEQRRADSYAEAQALLNDGQYAQAIALFTELDGYEEASKYLMYARAMELAEGGGYALAANSFSSLEDFRDSRLQMTYYRARLAESELRHEEAAALYETIVTFRDSATRLAAQSDLILERDFAVFRTIVMEEQDEGDLTYQDICRLAARKYSDSDTRMLEDFYQLGEDALAAGLYNSAYGVFTILSDLQWADSAARIQDVRYASSLWEMEMGEYWYALYNLEPLTEEGYAGAEEARNECYYQLGLEAEAQQNYAVAYSRYQQAGAHRDSADRAARFETAYAAAEALLSEGQYTQAAETFAALHNYADAPLRIPEAHYRHAEALLAAGEWSAASAAFAEAGEYEDAAGRIYEPFYRQGEALLKQEKYAEAITAFKRAGSFSDAKVRVQMVYYTLAEQHLAQGLYSEASAYFTSAGDYSDAAARVREPYYAQAEALLAEKKYDEAIELFVWLDDYSNAAERILMIHYDLAEQALAAGEYDTASAEFKLAGEYADASKRVKEPYYAQAEALLAEKKYDEAIELFVWLDDYSNAAERILMIHYDLAEQALAAGEYDTASAEFKLAGKYSDASTRVKEPYYAQAEKLLAEGKHDEAIAAFAALGGYADAATRVLMIHYDLAQSHLVEGAYEAAAIAFRSAGDYKDAASAMRYATACGLLEAEKYQEAEKAFLALGDFRDSADKAAQAHQSLCEAAYQEAMTLLENENYPEAEAAFLALGDYRDSADRAAQAYDIPRSAAYAAASALLAEEKHLEASDAFFALGDYRDSAEKAVSLRETALKKRYDEAEAFFAEGKYEEALDRYQAAAEYGDAARKAAFIADEYPPQLQNLRTYETAVELENKGNYARACELFRSLGDYRNSAVHAAACLINAGEFSYLSAPKDGAYLYQTRDGRFGYVSTRTGLILDDPSLRFNCVWQGDVAEVYRDERAGLINTDGEIIADCRWLDIGYFVNGRAVAMSETRQYGVINDDGTVYIQPDCPEAEGQIERVSDTVWRTLTTLIIDGQKCYPRDSKEELLPLNHDGSFVWECADGMWRYFSADGQVLYESENELGYAYGHSILYRDPQAKKWGMLDCETGKVLLKPVYAKNKYTQPFSISGMTKAYYTRKGGNDIYHVFNAKGKVLVSNADYLDNAWHHLFEYDKNYDQYYINADGKTVVGENKYESITVCSNGYITAQTVKKSSQYPNGKLRTAYLLDSSGKEIWKKTDAALGLIGDFPTIGEYRESGIYKLMIIDEDGVIHDDISVPGDIDLSEAVQLDENHVLLTNLQYATPRTSIILDIQNHRVASDVYVSNGAPSFGADGIASVLTTEPYIWEVISYGENGFQKITHTAPDRSGEPIVLTFPEQFPE